MEEFPTPENSLLELNIEQIRSMEFGSDFLEYQLDVGKFRITFSSRQAMELAIDKWLRNACERGQFFKLDVMKSMLQPRVRRSRRKRARPSA